MGCFNTACMVSGLPIQHREPVRFLLLTQHPNDHSSLVDGWVPRTAPLKALYNDYGSIEEVENTINQRSVIELLKKDVFDLSEKNPYLNNEFMRTWSFPDLTTAIHRNWIRLKHKNDPNHTCNVHSSRLEQAMIREDVFQMLLQYKIGRVDFHSFKHDAIKYIAELSSLGITDFYDFVFSSIPHLNEYTSCEDHASFIMKEIGKFPIDFHDCMLEFTFISLVLRKLNIAFSPSVSGGQEVEWENYIRFHEDILKIAKGLQNNSQS